MTILAPRSGMLALVAILTVVSSPAASSAGSDLTIDGLPFAVARPGADDVREIAVADGDVRLLLWTEPGTDGMPTDHYGISLDGRSIVRTVATSYEIGLGDAPFDPRVAIPAVDPRLAAGPGCRLWVVQFVTQPLEAFVRQLEALGGTVHHHVARHACLVEIEPEARAAIEALPHVRWVGAYHPAFRLERSLREAAGVAGVTGAAGDVAPLACNIQVVDASRKSRLAARIRALGGGVRQEDAGKRLVVAELTPHQLLAIARDDDVVFIDRWGPYETDMNLVREISGANYIELMGGYTGEGVRGEVFDVGFYLDHVDFASRPLIEHGGPVPEGIHGAAASGILFGDGTGNPLARGLLPDGQGLVAALDNVGMSGPGRYAHSAELVQPPWEAVFQSASIGSPRTELYTTVSAEMDQILFDLDIVFCQSQSNSGNTQSRPEAFAKNIISAGGILHRNTLGRDDDCWCGLASTGPASDGRVKPTLVHFADDIFTVGCCTPEAYGTFNGTSVSTPIVCGHVGLLFQMWADGLFGNPVDPGGTVFSNRAHMTTAKAMLVNTAYQYPFSGPVHDMARYHQGWGMPDLRVIYDERDLLFVVDETELLEPFAVAGYDLEVPDDQPAFKVTMTYADPPGNPAVQIQHRINDLDLRVIAPGGTVYHGNAGLLEGPWSTPGGATDTKNTVENVFVLAPEPGVWRVEVEAAELVEDGHVETPELDTDFALVAHPVLRPSTGIRDAAVGERTDSGPPRPDVPRLEILGLGPGLPAARLSFDLAADSPVRLGLFDVTGHLVRQLHDGALAAGRHTIAWNGRDAGGDLVPSGVYVARLEVAWGVETGKVLVLR
jgi:hypothetical protein